MTSTVAVAGEAAAGVGRGAIAARLGSASRSVAAPLLGDPRHNGHMRHLQKEQSPTDLHHGSHVGMVVSCARPLRQVRVVPTFGGAFDISRQYLANRRGTASRRRRKLHSFVILIEGKPPIRFCLGMFTTHNRQATKTPPPSLDPSPYYHIPQAPVQPT